MTDVCFVDCETTGLEPDRHAIWEVGLITPYGDEHVWQFPIVEVNADPFALDIGQWWDRRWSDDNDVPLLDAVYNAHTDKARRKNFPTQGRAVPPNATWCRHFRDLVGTSHLCGAVVSFDEERLRRLLRSMGVLPRWHYHLIDVEALAAGWLAGRAKGVDIALAQAPEGDDCRWTMRNTEDGPESVCLAHASSHKPIKTPSIAVPPWDSGELSRAVGVDPDDFDRHTALGDARWAKAIYQAVMG
jgi:oligoribonuclease (3'-5' exoribonuclease)